MFKKNKQTGKANIATKPSILNIRSVNPNMRKCFKRLQYFFKILKKEKEKYFFCELSGT